MCKKSKPRIDMIDNFRGFAMMYVIFIHCLHWIDFFPDTRTLFFIEMPLFFSISGMALYFSPTENLIHFYKARLKRILFPYWRCILLYCALNAIFFVRLDAEYSPLELLLSWLNPFTDPISIVSYLENAMWFVPVYIGIIVIFPFLRRFIQKFAAPLSSLPPALLAGANFCFTFYLDVPDLLQKVLFYAFWVYFGLYYMKYIHGMTAGKKLKIYLPFMIAGTLGFIYIVSGEFADVRGQIIGLDMQENKFPPNFAFFLYEYIITII